MAPAHRALLPRRRDEDLKDAALGAGAVFRAGDDLAKDIGEGVGGLAGDLDTVVAEDGLPRVREEEVQPGAVAGEVAREELFEGEQPSGPTTAGAWRFPGQTAPC